MAAYAMRGPTDYSNWLVKDQIIVGAYPGSLNDAYHESTLSAILSTGVSTFVCLQRELVPNASDEDWREGRLLRPYHRDLVSITKRMRKHRMGHVDQKSIRFVYFPITDQAVVRDTDAILLIKELMAEIVKGRKLYIHCHGGHGRAGTVAAVLLGVLFNMSPAQALAAVQTFHDERVNHQNARSPQVLAQVEQVHRVIQTIQNTKEITGLNMYQGLDPRISVWGQLQCRMEEEGWEDIQADAPGDASSVHETSSTTTASSNSTRHSQHTTSSQATDDSSYTRCRLAQLAAARADAVAENAGDDNDSEFTHDSIGSTLWSDTSYETMTTEDSQATGGSGLTQTSGSTYTTNMRHGVVGNQSTRKPNLLDNLASPDQPHESKSIAPGSISQALPHCHAAQLTRTPSIPTLPPLSSASSLVSSPSPILPPASSTGASSRASVSPKSSQVKQNAPAGVVVNSQLATLADAIDDRHLLGLTHQRSSSRSQVDTPVSPLRVGGITNGNASNGSVRTVSTTSSARATLSTRQTEAAIQLPSAIAGRNPSIPSNEPVVSSRESAHHRVRDSTRSHRSGGRLIVSSRIPTIISAPSTPPVHSNLNSPNTQTTNYNLASGSAASSTHIPSNTTQPDSTDAEAHLRSISGSLRRALGPSYVTRNTLSPNFQLVGARPSSSSSSSTVHAVSQSLSGISITGASNWATPAENNSSIANSSSGSALASSNASSITSSRSRY